MDLVVEGEDRISKLPDDVIHRILSSFDMKYAVQTSILSRRWKRIWTSMSCLNFNSRLFHTKPLFAKFVKHALSHRNNHIKVSSLDLSFTGTTAQFFVKDIVKYAYLYNVSQLTMKWATNMVHELPRYLFSSYTLKHLTLNDESPYRVKSSHLPASAWHFPALETLNLSNMRLDCGGDKRLDLFTKCVNLKDLTLHGFYMHGLEIFSVCAPQLVNLTFTDSVTFPNEFKVVAPQLKKLTASVSASMNGVGPNFLPFSAEGFSSLEKVSLSLSKRSDKWASHSQILNLFQILHSAKLLILDVGIIESLSLSLDQLSHKPCPFNKLKCLKIDMMQLKQNEHIITIPVQVKNYFLKKSPSAAFIMDFPQKRSREQVSSDTTAKKVAKLELPEKSMLEAKIKTQLQVIAQHNAILEAQLQATGQQREKIRIQDQVIAQQEEKLKMQDQDIAKQKALFEALKLQHDKLMSHFIERKMEEVNVLFLSKNPDYEVIRSMGCDMKSVMDLIPPSLRVAVKSRFSSFYEGLKSLLSHSDASLWAQIEHELGNIMDSERTRSDKLCSESDIPAAEASAMPSMSSSDLVVSSSIAW